MADRKMHAHTHTHKSVDRAHHSCQIVPRRLVGGSGWWSRSRQTACQYCWQQDGWTNTCGSRSSTFLFIYTSYNCTLDMPQNACAVCYLYAENVSTAHLNIPRWVNLNVFFLMYTGYVSALQKHLPVTASDPYVLVTGLGRLKPAHPFVTAVCLRAESDPRVNINVAFPGQRLFIIEPRHWRTRPLPLLCRERQESKHGVKRGAAEMRGGSMEDEQNDGERGRRESVNEGW